MMWTILLCMTVTLQCVHGVTIGTEWGPVTGHTVALHNGISVDSYLGIPFAKPPIGARRFREPEDPDPWTESFEADSLRSACPQGTALFVFTHPLWNDTNEDCLHMNIFTPNDKSRGPYAVMVWFHGGGYVGSANIQYPGHFLAMRDVVVVVPNYRLGALGYMSTGDSAAWGNYGMMDQIKVLQFIQNNIAAFGGDPNKVTLFGQSAGASSASLHMFSPLSRGLFHRVIAESGNDMALWAVNWPNQNPENYTKQVAEKLECPINDNQAMMECLRGIDAETLRTTGFDCKPGHFCQGFAPVVDHPGGYLPKTPHEYRQEGDYQKVDLISGICSEDGSWYVAALVPESLEGPFNRSEWLYLLRNNLVSIFAPRLSEKRTEDTFQAMSFYYSPWPHIDDEEENRQAFNTMITDIAFGAHMDAQVKDQLQYNPNVYEYIMGYRSVNASEFIPEWMGVPHNGEMPYVIGYPFLKINEDVRDDSGIYWDIVDWVDEDIEYSEFIQTMWTNFAKTGNPTPEPVERPFGKGPITWSALGEELNYLNMYRDVTVEKEYRQQNHAFWLEYMIYVTGFNLFPLPESSSHGGVEGTVLASNYMEQFLGDFLMEAVEERMMAN